MTKKFGIIGDPIKHSLSPVLHNYWFKKYDIDAEYSIIQIRENQISKIVNEIRKKELTGINITLPYKQKIVPHVDLLINDAEVTGSVNTLYCNDNERIVGENTDVFGLQAAYLKELDKASINKVLVIGAGGVSPSVILSLQKSGAKEIFLTNRTMEKCIFFKKKFKFLK
ncbi:MAG: shikimate dehydrogenase, partial [Pseudomonadota bacterium]|nr:shikimate dehydrogenase [Pseudomonadota bacterium]